MRWQTRISRKVFHRSRRQLKCCGGSVLQCDCCHQEQDCVQDSPETHHIKCPKEVVNEHFCSCMTSQCAESFVSGALTVIVQIYSSVGGSDLLHMFQISVINSILALSCTLILFVHSITKETLLIIITKCNTVTKKNKITVNSVVKV